MKGGRICNDEMEPYAKMQWGGMQHTSAGLHLGTDPKINLWSDVFSLRLHYTCHWQGLATRIRAMGIQTLCSDCRR
jgi:hypothetical protein